MSDKCTKHLLELDEAQKNHAAVYLNENIDEREEKIDEIRKWIMNSEDLCSRTDDFFILRFLRCCKFNVENAKRKLRNYLEQRIVSPEWFSNRNPFLPELQELFQLGVFLPLRQLDDQGRMVVIIRACIHDPKKHKQSDVFKAGMMILDIASREHVPLTLNGIVAVHDMTGVTFSHALQLPPRMIKRLVHSWQAAYPIRIQSMDFVNAPIHVNVVLRVFKRFMSRKMRQRVHVHVGGYSSVLDQVPSRILPAEFGGDDGNFQTLSEYWKQQVEENQSWFVEDEKYKLKS